MLIAISLFGAMLAKPALAKNGDAGGDGDSGENHDSSDYHDPIYNHFVLGIGDSYYNLWFWADFYGPSSSVSSGYPNYGYGFGVSFYRSHYVYTLLIRIPSLSLVYIQQQEPKRTLPNSNYWYYCKKAKGDYPYIKECPSGWTLVISQPDTQ